MVPYERTSLCCKLRIGKAVPNLGVYINLLNSILLVIQSFSLDFCTAVLLTFYESGVLKEENGPERSEDTDFDHERSLLFANDSDNSTKRYIVASMEKYKASLVSVYFEVHTLSFSLWVSYCCTGQNLYLDARSNSNGNKC